MKSSWKIAIVVAVAIAIVVVMAAKEAPSPAEAPTDVAQHDPAEPAEIDAAAEQTARFVEVGAESCVPCKMMQPVLEEMREDYAGALEIEFANLDENAKLAEQYGVRTIPTQIIYDAEGTEIFRHQGFWPKDQIDAKLKELDVIE